MCEYSTDENSETLEMCCVCGESDYYDDDYIYRFYDVVICEDCIDFIKCMICD